MTRIGIGTGDYASWSKVKLSDGSEVYVASSYLTTKKPSVGSNQQGQQNTELQQEQGHPTSDYDPDASGWDPYEGLTPEEREAAIKANQEATQKIVDGITGSFG